MDEIKQLKAGNHFLGRFIDHELTYGRHVIAEFMRLSVPFRNVVDLGAGSGADLKIAKEIYPHARTIALECGAEYLKNLETDEKINLNIENDVLPFSSESIELFIGNQVLEHTKEIFWIFHEVTRCLKIGGHFIIGVPNLASLHNRFLLLFGKHPTQFKSFSAHIRPFSKHDLERFLSFCFPQGYTINKFRGSQFYPFPRQIAMILSHLLPNMAFSIFFLLEKTKEYRDEFITFPVKEELETNFYLGKTSQYQREWSHKEESGA